MTFTPSQRTSWEPFFPLAQHACQAHRAPWAWHLIHTLWRTEFASCPWTSSLWILSEISHRSLQGSRLPLSLPSWRYRTLERPLLGLWKCKFGGWSLEIENWPVGEPLQRVDRACGPVFSLGQLQMTPLASSPLLRLAVFVLLYYDIRNEGKNLPLRILSCSLVIGISLAEMTLVPVHSGSFGSTRPSYSEALFLDWRCLLEDVLAPGI